MMVRCLLTMDMVFLDGRNVGYWGIGIRLRLVIIIERIGVKRSIRSFIVLLLRIRRERYWSISWSLWEGGRMFLR